MVFHYEEVLYQVYAPLPYLTTEAGKTVCCICIFVCVPVQGTSKSCGGIWMDIFGFGSLQDRNEVSGYILSTSVIGRDRRWHDFVAHMYAYSI